MLYTLNQVGKAIGVDQFHFGTAISPATLASIMQAGVYGGIYWQMEKGEGGCILAVPRGQEIHYIAGWNEETVGNNYVSFTITSGLYSDIWTITRPGAEVKRIEHPMMQRQLDKNARMIDDDEVVWIPSDRKPDHREVIQYIHVGPGDVRINSSTDFPSILPAPTHTAQVIGSMFNSAYSDALPAMAPDKQRKLVNMVGRAAMQLCPWVRDDAEFRMHILSCRLYLSTRIGSEEDLSLFCIVEDSDNKLQMQKVETGGRADDLYKLIKEKWNYDANYRVS